MTKVTVMHVKDLMMAGDRSLFGEIDLGRCPVDPDQNHEIVAEVEVEAEGMAALEEAFRLTNHIDHSWTQNEEVVVLKKARPRSTSVGDVMILDGEKYVCAHVGWTKLTSADQKLGLG